MDKNFDEWNEMKKEINSLEFMDPIDEREVWWCSLGVNVGFEQDGKNEQFERPVLILLKFSKDSALVIPFTSQHKVGKYYFSVTHERKETALILSQIRLISTKRLLRKMYKMDTKTFDRLRDTVCSMIQKTEPPFGDSS